MNHKRQTGSNGCSPPVARPRLDSAVWGVTGRRWACGVGRAARRGRRARSRRRACRWAVSVGAGACAILALASSEGASCARARVVFGPIRLRSRPATTGGGLEVVGGGLDEVSDPETPAWTSNSGASMAEIERSRRWREVGGPQNVRGRTPKSAPDPCPCPPDPLPSSQAVIEVCSGRSELEHCGAAARRGPRLHKVCSGRSEVERSLAPSEDAGPSARPELGRVEARARRRRAGRAAG